MTLEEIKTALKSGKVVHWGNTGYIVTISENFFSGLAVCFVHNGYYTALMLSELKDCFIKGE